MAGDSFAHRYPVSTSHTPSPARPWRGRQTPHCCTGRVEGIGREHRIRSWGGGWTPGEAGPPLPPCPWWWPEHPTQGPPWSSLSPRGPASFSASSHVLCAQTEPRRPGRRRGEGCHRPARTLLAERRVLSGMPLPKRCLSKVHQWQLRVLITHLLKASRQGRGRGREVL